MVRNILRVMHRHSGDECLPQRLSQKVTLIAPRVASEASKVLMVRSWMSVIDAIRSTPGAFLLHLGGRIGRDEYVTCVGKGQTKSDQERKALL